MQDLFHKVVGKSYNLERGEIGSDREHLTKAQWEQKQIVAEKEQLTAVVEPYREMRAEIDKVDIQGKKNLFGGVVVKQDELETLVKHAKAYAANKNKIDNYETRQKAVADKEHDLNLREVKTNYLEHCARNLHDQQKDLNDNYHELQKKLKNQDDKLEKLKGAFEKQGTEYMNIREAYCNAVLAAGMLVWDDETGYKVDLPPEAINLINAINSRAEMDFIEVGDKKHAEDVRNYIGIDERIKRLIPEQKETELHHEIKDQNQEELFIAVLEDSPEKIEKALESGAKISTLFKNETALHIAVLERKYKAAENLLKNGAYVDALDGNLKTPLYDAAKQNDTKMAELLLDNGASTSLCIGKKSIQDMPKSQEMNELFYYHDKEIQRTNHISPPHISR
jgi:autonomous glycyl radical cofactor GrcA